jgi:hypothetical protein
MTPRKWLRVKMAPYWMSRPVNKRERERGKEREGESV